MEEDKKLYKEFLNGNKDAFDRIVNKYKNNLIYFITRYVKDPEIAEDIFQDCLLYLLENKEKYDFKYSLKTYLYTIAKSRALNYLSKNKKIVELNEDTYKDEKLPEDIIFSNERKEKILKVINKLPKDYQMVIYLTKLEGLSYKDTSIIMDKTPNQIRTLTHNAKKKLKKLLVDEKIIEVNKNKVIRFLVLIFAIGLLTSGIVYASVSIYKKYIWKEPEKFNYMEEKEVTEEDKQNIMTEEEAKEKVLEIAKKLGYDNLNIEKAEIIKYPDDKEIEWMFNFKEKIFIQIDAYTGKLRSFSDNSIDDTKIESKMSKEEVEQVIREIYNNLGYTNEYTLIDLSKVSVVDNTNLWQADFCKVYDGVVNTYECIRITVIPETNHLYGLNIFDYKTENNPIEISEEDAINIAKEKAKSLGRKEEEIESINAELKFEKMNTFVYSQEMYEERNNVSTNTTTISSTEDNYSYRTDNLVRKVWRIEIKYKNDLFSDVEAYFIDCTTGEIIGGDAIK